MGAFQRTDWAVMIFPTLLIDVYGVPRSDVYGQPIIINPIREKVAPVKLIFDNQHTTVRTDSAASHGNAYEGTANVVVLAGLSTKIELDCILGVCGNKVKVIYKHIRHRTTGEADHYEIRCIAWK